TAQSDGLGAVAGLDLGARTGPAMGALGDSFLDGMRLCLITAGSLTLLAALVAVVLLRAPRQQGTLRAAGHTTASAEQAPAARGA
ncbi:hypothetical protein ABT404_47070, partial [Streptomyces hyaluromycini]